MTNANALTRVLHNETYDYETSEYKIEATPETSKYVGIVGGDYSVSFPTDDNGDFLCDENGLRQALRHTGRMLVSWETVSNNRQQQVRSALGAVGALMREAAIAQGWCGEYEQWRQQIIDALNNSLDDGEAITKFREASDRRKKFSVEVTFMAKDAYSAQDFVYNLTQGYLDATSVRAHDVVTGAVSELTDTPEDEDDDSDE